MRIYGGGDRHGWLSRRSLSRRRMSPCLWYRINEKFEGNADELPVRERWLIRGFPRAPARRAAPAATCGSALDCGNKTLLECITLSISYRLASVVSTFLRGRCRARASTIKHTDAFPFRAPVCIERLFPRRFGRHSGYRRVAIGTRHGASLFKPPPAYADSIYLARCLRAKELSLSLFLFLALSLYRLILTPVGCLISHPLDTFFIARLTISDNAHGRGSRRNERKCDDRAADKGPLDKCSKTGVRIDIGSPRPRYTSAINHISR